MSSRIPTPADLAAGLSVKAPRPKWDENLHPRDRKGRFIEVGARVLMWGGSSGTVVRNVGGGRIEVRREQDGQNVIVHRNYLTVSKRPDGSRPVDKPGDDVRDAPVEKPSTNAREVAPAAGETPDDDPDDVDEPNRPEPVAQAPAAAAQAVPGVLTPAQRSRRRRQNVAAMQALFTNPDWQRQPAEAHADVPRESPAQMSDTLATRGEFLTRVLAGPGANPTMSVDGNIVVAKVGPRWVAMTYPGLRNIPGGAFRNKKDATAFADFMEQANLPDGTPADFSDPRWHNNQWLRSMFGDREASGGVDVWAAQQRIRFEQAMGLTPERGAFSQFGRVSNETAAEHLANMQVRRRHEVMRNSGLPSSRARQVLSGEGVVLSAGDTDVVMLREVQPGDRIAVPRGRGQGITIGTATSVENRDGFIRVNLSDGRAYGGVDDEGDGEPTEWITGRNDPVIRIGTGRSGGLADGEPEPVQRVDSQRRASDIREGDYIRDENGSRLRVTDVVDTVPQMTFEGTRDDGTEGTHVAMPNDWVTVAPAPGDEAAPDGAPPAPQRPRRETGDEAEIRVRDEGTDVAAGTLKPGDRVVSPTRTNGDRSQRLTVTRVAERADGNVEVYYEREDGERFSDIFDRFEKVNTVRGYDRDEEAADYENRLVAAERLAVGDRIRLSTRNNDTGGDYVEITGITENRIDDALVIGFRWPNGDPGRQQLAKDYKVEREPASTTPDTTPPPAPTPPAPRRPAVRGRAAALAAWRAQFADGNVPEALMAFGASNRTEERTQQRREWLQRIAESPDTTISANGGVVAWKEHGGGYNIASATSLASLPAWSADSKRDAQAFADYLDSGEVKMPDGTDIDWTSPGWSQLSLMSDENRSGLAKWHVNVKAEWDDRNGKTDTLAQRLRAQNTEADAERAAYGKFTTDGGYTEAAPRLSMFPPGTEVAFRTHRSERDGRGGVTVTPVIVTGTVRSHYMPPSLNGRATTTLDNVRQVDLLTGRESGPQGESRTVETYTAGLGKPDPRPLLDRFKIRDVRRGEDGNITFTVGGESARDADETGIMGSDGKLAGRSGPFALYQYGLYEGDNSVNTDRALRADLVEALRAAADGGGTPVPAGATGDPRLDNLGISNPRRAGGGVDMTVDIGEGRQVTIGVSGARQILSVEPMTDYDAFREWVRQNGDFGQGMTVDRPVFDAAVAVADRPAPDPDVTPPAPDVSPDAEGFDVDVLFNNPDAVRANLEAIDPDLAAEYTKARDAWAALEANPSLENAEAFDTADTEMRDTARFRARQARDEGREGEEVWLRQLGENAPASEVYLSGPDDSAAEFNSRMERIMDSIETDFRGRSWAALRNRRDGLGGLHDQAIDQILLNRFGRDSDGVPTPGGTADMTRPINTTSDEGRAALSEIRGRRVSYWGGDPDEVDTAWVYTDERGDPYLIHPDDPSRRRDYDVPENVERFDVLADDNFVTDVEPGELSIAEIDEIMTEITNRLTTMQRNGGPGFDPTTNRPFMALVARHRALEAERVSPARAKDLEAWKRQQGQRSPGQDGFDFDAPEPPAPPAPAVTPPTPDTPDRRRASQFGVGDRMRATDPDTGQDGEFEVVDIGNPVDESRDVDIMLRRADGTTFSLTDVNPDTEFEVGSDDDGDRTTEMSVPASDVRVGEQVYARDRTTGLDGWHTVTAVEDAGAAGVEIQMRNESGRGWSDVYGRDDQRLVRRNDTGGDQGPDLPNPATMTGPELSTAIREAGDEAMRLWRENPSTDNAEYLRARDRYNALMGEAKRREGVQQGQVELQETRARNIKVGDLVYTVNGYTGESGLYEVTEVDGTTLTFRDGPDGEWDQDFYQDALLPVLSRDDAGPGDAGGGEDTGGGSIDDVDDSETVAPTPPVPAVDTRGRDSAGYGDVTYANLRRGDHITMRDGYVVKVRRVTETDEGDAAEIEVENGAGQRYTFVLRKDATAKAVPHFGAGAAGAAYAAPPAGTSVSRPNLYTYQRRMLLGLGLDQGTPGTDLTAAGAALRARKPLTAAQSQAVAAYLTRLSAEDSVPDAKKRSLMRLHDRMMAAEAQAAGRPAPPKSNRTVTATRPDGVAVEDTIAIPNPDGSVTVAKVVSARSMARGRLFVFDVEDPTTGNRTTVMRTSDTDMFVLPDTADPVVEPDVPSNAPFPDGGAEVVSNSQLRVGDRILVSAVSISDPPLEVVIEEDPNATGDRSGPYFTQTAMGTSRRVYLAEIDNDSPVVRIERGELSADQAPSQLQMVDVAADGREVPLDDMGDLRRGQAFRHGPRFGWITGTPERAVRADDDSSYWAVSWVGGDGREYTEFVDNPAQFRAFGDPQPEAVSILFGARDSKRIRREQESMRSLMSQQMRTAVDERLFNSWVQQDWWPAVRRDAPDGGGDPDGRIAATVKANLTRFLQSRRDDTTSEATQRIREVNDIARRLEGMIAGGADDQQTRDARIAALKPTAEAIVARMDLYLQNTVDNFVIADGETPDEAFTRIRTAHRGTAQAPYADEFDEVIASLYRGGLNLDTQQVEPVGTGATVEDIPSGGELRTRLNRYRAAIGGTFGHGSVRVQSLEVPSIEDLRKGVLPTMVETVVTRQTPDATDGGPSETSMRHLEIVRAAGRDLDAAVNVEIGNAVGMPNYDEVLQTLTARVDEARRERDAFISAGGRYGSDGYRTRADAVSNLLNERDDLAKKIGEARRTATIKVLESAGVKMGGVPQDYFKPAGGGRGRMRFFAGRGAQLTERGDLVKRMRYAEASYPAAWLETLKGHYKQGFLLSAVRRGHFTEVAGTPQIALSGGNTVAVHELGHAMEKAIPGLLAAQRAILWDRTSEGEIGNRTQQRKEHMGRGYGTREVTRPDKFPERYTGKDYNDRAYEIFTTQIESLMAGSKYADDDLRQWTLGVLATLAHPVEPEEQEVPPAPEKKGRKKRAAFKDRESLGADFVYIGDLPEDDPVKKDLMEVFGYKHEGTGFRVEINERGSYLQPGRTVMRGKIVTADGENVGSVQRSIIKHADGRVEVHHDLLTVGAKHQGGGFANDFYEHLYREYEAMGVTDVTIQANIDIGGYAWAQRGFDWAGGRGLPTRKKAASKLEYALYYQMKVEGEEPTRRTANATTTITAEQKARMERFIGDLRDSKVKLSPYDVANALSDITWIETTPDGKEFKMWPGKKAMLGRNWMGEFRLAANNPPERIIPAGRKFSLHQIAVRSGIPLADLQAMSSATGLLTTAQARGLIGAWKKAQG